MTKIAAFSDIHGNIKNYKDIFPGIELVILPGDFCNLDDVEEQKKEFPELSNTLVEMFPDAQEFIVVPGNHDFLLERISTSWNPELEYRNLLGHKFRVLVDEKYVFTNLLNGDEITMYGCPRTDLNMAFPHLWGNNDIKRIPSGLDFLITHEAPRWYDLPCVKEYVGRFGTSEPGSKLLYDRVQKVRPKIHFFGHIHRQCSLSDKNTTYYNCSQMWGGNFSPNIIMIDYSPLEGTKIL